MVMMRMIVIIKPCGLGISRLVSGGVQLNVSWPDRRLKPWLATFLVMVYILVGGYLKTQLSK